LKQSKLRFYEKEVVKMVMDVHQLAKEIGISEGGIYHWVSQKKIPHIKIGRNVRFDSEAIKAWLEKKKVEPRDFN